MNSKFWIQKTLSAFMVAVTIATYSMITLAGTDKIAGELLISGKMLNGQAASVKVNGETAQSGRSIFTGSTITTPKDASAVVSLGKAGKIELAPDSTASLSFDEKTISGNLTVGRLTVLSASESVSVTTAEGKVVKLDAGDSTDASAQQTQSKNSGGTGSFFGGHGLLLATIVIGGAAVALIFAATTGNNRVALGGGTVVVSTTR